MANLEWDIAHQLTSIYGTLDINVPDVDTGRVYRIQPDTYKMIPSLRVTQDNISQADGSVLHPRWTSGLTAIMQVALNIQIDPAGPDMEPACGADLREMGEELILHLNAMRKQAVDAQRLYWTPTGYGDLRLLQDIMLLAIWDPSYDLSGVENLISFAVESPFPYAIDFTQQEIEIANDATVAITNTGNSPFSPVMLVTGPGGGATTDFQILTDGDPDFDGNDVRLVYDSTRPGAVPIAGGTYAEIDFFQGSVIKNGDGADLIAGINPELTDFFKINPGVNNIQASGCDITVLMNNAWA